MLLLWPMRDVIFWLLMALWLCHPDDQAVVRSSLWRLDQISAYSLAEGSIERKKMYEYNMPPQTVPIPITIHLETSQACQPSNNNRQNFHVESCPPTDARATDATETMSSCGPPTKIQHPSRHHTSSSSQRSHYITQPSARAPIASQVKSKWLRRNCYRASLPI